jgi:CheY-like chemotaxis protein
MFTSPTLLITDDDHDLRESLGSVFASRGFHTLLAADGCEACDVVQQNEVHLVLIDYHMPRMSGLEALQTIKKFNRQLPVILMSARLDDQMSSELLAADAFAIHAKPIDISRIRSDVSAALRTIYNWSVDGPSEPT